MLIYVFRHDRQQGFLHTEKSGSSVKAPFFGGANVAFRRTALEEIGPYDNRMPIGEDADICIRLGRTDWELYRSTDAMVYHENPFTLSAMIKQWKGYLVHMPLLIKKHNLRAFEVFGYDPGIQEIRCLYITRWTPIRAVIVWNRFLRFHLCFALFPILLVAGFPEASVLLLAMGLYWGLGYFRRTVRWFRSVVKENKAEKLVSPFVALKYIEDLTVLVYGIWGGVKHGMILLYGDPRC